MGSRTIWEYGYSGLRKYFLPCINSRLVYLYFSKRNSKINFSPNANWSQFFFSSNKSSHFLKAWSLLSLLWFHFSNMTHSDAKWRKVTHSHLSRALGRFVAVAAPAVLAAAAAAQLASSQKNVQSTLEYINFWSFAHNQAASSSRSSAFAPLSSSSSPHLQALTFERKLLFYDQFTRMTYQVGGGGMS